MCTLLLRPVDLVDPVKFYNFNVSKSYKIVYFPAVIGNCQTHGLAPNYFLVLCFSERGLLVEKVDLGFAVFIDFIISSQGHALFVTVLLIILV